jgi:hypothetical protein
MELKYTARALGVEGDGDASWPGDLHGDATEVRAAGIRGMRALLDSVESAEVSLRDAYEQALPHCDAGPLGQLVRDHLAALRRTGLRLAQTRQAYEQKVGSPSRH